MNVFFDVDGRSRIDAVVQIKRSDRATELELGADESLELAGGQVLLRPIEF